MKIKPDLKVGTVTFDSKSYKIRKNGVLFLNSKSEPFSFLVANKHNERFFVSCAKAENGKLFYMFSLSNIDKNLLGLSDMTYTQEHEEAKRIWKLVNLDA